MNSTNYFVPIGHSNLLFAADRGEVLPIVTPDNMFVGARVCRHEPIWSLMMPAEHLETDGGNGKLGTIVDVQFPGHPDQVIVAWVCIFLSSLNIKNCVILLYFKYLY